MLSARNAWSLLRQTFTEWNEDKVPRLGAALAFYTALSMAPLLVLSLRIAAYFFDDEAARGELVHQLRGLMGTQGAEAVQEMIARGNEPTNGAIATVLGVATLLFGASGLFGQLQDSLNTIWEVQPKPRRGILGFVRDRFLSFSMVLGIAFLLLVSLALSAVITLMGSTLGTLSESWQWIGHVSDFVVSWALITVLFAMMFKLLPDVEMAWRDVWLGAVLTALMFMVGKLAIGFYLGHSAMASAYGVAGSFVVLLVWIYYAAQIFFFGAEFTQVYANRYGSRIEPAEHAEKVPEIERAQRGEMRKPAFG